ncbi:UNVERIFIED_CONTAM: hypothetical protein K2H54_015273 [Gekko kuhli]
MEKADSQHQDLHQVAEESQPQDLSDEPDEDSKLTDIIEQNEDSIPQDPNEQSEGGIQIRLETSEQQASEERGKDNTDWVDETSSFLVSEPSTSSQIDFLSSDTETIKHSPLKIAKSSYVRGFMQKPQASHFKGSEIIPPYERMRKQRISAGLQRKKESKGFYKARPHTTGSCEGSCRHLGRRSKALYNLYTTFCDEEEEADPGFLQGAEGSPAASGLSRACTVFSVLKKGRINVSNLLLTLHTMGILVARADMHQALKCIAVDERGNLNFLEFLNVVSLTTPFAGTKALQKAQEVFRKLKKDMVAVEDLEPTLACLGVTMSPMIIKQALGRVQTTWDGKVNISDFLSTVRGLQSCCDKASYREEYPTLNWRSFGDANDVGYSELRWRRKCSLDREIFAPRIPMVTFCSAEEAIAFTELQRQKSKPQRAVDLKRPRTASPASPAEEEKKKDIIKWPKARQGFGYTSQDTLFPLESTLCSKKMANARVQQAETEETVNQSGEDSPSLLSRLNITPRVNQTKKKRLSFFHELPKRYSAEDSRVPTFT